MADDKDIQNQNVDQTAIPAPTFQKSISDNFENKAYDITENIVVPKPEDIPDKALRFDEEITVDDIIDEILKVDEDGRPLASLIITVEQMHNFFPKNGMIDDTDHEYMRQLELDYVQLKLDSPGDDETMLIMNFGSKDDAYYKETFDIYTYYKLLRAKANQKLVELGEDTVITEENDVPLPAVTLIIAPYKFNGKALASFTNPKWVIKMFDDETDTNGNIGLVFKNEDIDFSLVSMTEEETTDLQADIMRELSAGHNMFEE